jgi:hypothetical protein
MEIGFVSPNFNDLVSHASFKGESIANEVNFIQIVEKAGKIC